MTDSGLAPIENEDGRFRVNADKCTTCLFNPERMGNGMRGVIDDARERESFVMCHETYVWGDQDEHQPADGVEPAMCRGYWDAYKGSQYGLMLLDRCGAMVDVPTPPAPEFTGKLRLLGDMKSGIAAIVPAEGRIAED